MEFLQIKEPGFIITGKTASWFIELPERKKTLMSYDLKSVLKHAVEAVNESEDKYPAVTAAKRLYKGFEELDKSEEECECDEVAHSSEIGKKIYHHTKCMGLAFPLKFPDEPKQKIEKLEVDMPFEAEREQILRNSQKILEIIDHINKEI